MSKSDVIANAVSHARAGEEGRLKLGGDLLEWSDRGGSVGEFRERLHNQGVSLPSDGRLSAYKQAYKAWCDGAGFFPDHEPVTHSAVKDANGALIPLHITGVTVDKLYALKDEVNSINAPDLLAWAYTHTDAEHRARGRHTTPSGRDQEAREAPPTEEVRVKSLRLNEDSYNAFLSLVDRLRNVLGNPNISKAQTFDFVTGQFDPDSLSDEGLSFLWRQAHGEVTEEEMEAAEEIDLEITDD